MTETRGQARAVVNASPAVMWQQTRATADLLTTDQLRVHPPTGAGDRISLSPEAGGSWDGHLHLLDEDEIELERHYRLTARSERHRAAATVVLRLDPRRGRSTSVTVTCCLRCTSAEDLSPEWLAAQWVGALRAASLAWPVEPAAPVVPATPSSVDAEAATQSRGAWWGVAAAFAAGIVAGFTLRTAVRLAIRERCWS